MKLTEKTMNQVMKESEEAIVQLSQGKSAIDIAANIYCSGLPDKEFNTGIVMAKRIEATVLDYEKSVKMAMENPEEWVGEQIQKQLEGKDLEERCRILFDLLIAISTLNDVLSGLKTVEEIRDEYSFDIRLVSEEYEATLKNQLINAAKMSSYGEFILRELSKIFESKNDEVSVEDIIDYGKHEHDVKVIMAMIAYVNAKKGAIEELPAEISLDEITIAVASEYDVLKTAAQVEEGKISSDMGAKIIKAISTVASFMIATVLTAISLMFVGVVIDVLLPIVVGIPLVIISGFVFWELFTHAGKRVVDCVMKLGAKVINGGYSLVKKGIKKTAQLFSEKVVPKVKEAWNNIKAYLKKLKHENTEEQQEEEATVQA